MRLAYALACVPLLVSTESLAYTVGVDYAPGEVVLTFAATFAPGEGEIGATPLTVGIPELDSILGAYDGQELVKLVPGYSSTLSAGRTYLFRYSGATDPLDVAAALTQLPYFDRVSPNGLLHWVPNGTIRVVPSSSTTRFGDQWYFDNADAGDKSDIDMPEAWAIETGDLNGAIGIFDTGTMVDTCGNESIWRLHSDFNYLFLAGEDRGAQGVLNRFDLNGADNNSDGIADNVIGTNVSLGCDAICGDPNPVSPWDGPAPEPEPKPSLPTRYALDAAHPNPFNPTTTIAFDVPSPGGDIEISVFDVKGAKVRTLVDRHHEAGTHSVTWTGRSDSDDPVASGVYFVRMTAPSFTQTRKLVLLK